MRKIVLLRHGESIWNKENRFTGWTDIDLSEKGYEEAKNAAALLNENGFTFDIAFTSVLKRGIRTLWIILEEMDLMWIPVHRSWKLNERHYGALQGLYKAKLAEKLGEKQVLIWRRSYDTPPPALTTTDKRNPYYDRKYKKLKIDDVPLSESLKETINRVIPYWNEEIVPNIKAGKQIIVSAHGNSIRAIVKHLDNLSKKEIIELNIPTGIPLIYEFNENLKPIRHYYLGDPEEIRRATIAVANQGSSMMINQKGDRSDEYFK